MNYPKSFKFLLVIISSGVLMFNCSKKKDENPAPAEVVTPAPEMRKTSYAFSDFGRSGNITLVEMSANQTRINIALNSGLPSGQHPANIYENSTLETGAVLHQLTNVDSTGKSSTVLNVPYSTLVSINGHINIIQSGTNDTYLAKGDIGSNILTGKIKEYNIKAVTGQSVSGTIKLEERVNGSTLATLNLSDVLPSETYMASLRYGKSDNDRGLVDVLLNNVSGNTKMSKTNIRSYYDKPKALTYSELLSEPRFVNVTTSDSTLVATGDIGSNL